MSTVTAHSEARTTNDGGGRGWAIALVDSGLSAGLADSPGINLSGEADATDTTDCCGHGTTVASTILGIAPGNRAGAGQGDRPARRAARPRTGWPMPSRGSPNSARGTPSVSSASRSATRAVLFPTPHSEAACCSSGSLPCVPADVLTLGAGRQLAPAQWRASRRNGVAGHPARGGERWRSRAHPGGPACQRDQPAAAQEWATWPAPPHCFTAEGRPAKPAVATAVLAGVSPGSHKSGRVRLPASSPTRSRSSGGWPTTTTTATSGRR
jgi:hypothetical protein